MCFSAVYRDMVSGTRGFSVVETAFAKNKCTFQNLTGNAHLCHLPKISIKIDYYQFENAYFQ